MNIFGTIMTAMVSPLNANLGLDLNKTTALVEHLLQSGTDTIVLAGTTGESPTLTKEEKITLFTHAASVSNGRVKIIANVGTNNTEESVAFAQTVDEMPFIDGIMVVNPYYNKPSQKGLYEHFSTVARATKKPVMLYNIPGRTGVNLSVDTAVKLAEIPNIVALKESTGDLSQMAKIIDGVNGKMAVYSGDDNLTLPVLAIGGKGVVSVASHIVGPEMKRMIEHFQNGDTLGASIIHRKLLGFFEGIFPSYAPNPVAIKELLKHKGIDVGGVRLPLLPLDDSEKELLLSQLKSYL